MPPPLLFDLDRIDLTTVSIPQNELYERLPHRHEFMLLDGGFQLDLDALRLVTFLDVREDGWWIRGHVPGRPIFPGVLMLEAAAQTSAILAKVVNDDYDSFIGFGGVDDCRFREPAIPPARLVFLCQLTENRPRRITSSVQGLIGSKLAFEAKITGMRLP